MGILSTNKKIINLGQGYSAGSGISIDDYVISVTGEFGHTYSAGPNIDIYDDQGQLYISGKDWSADIANASSNAYEQATALIPPEFDPTYMSGAIEQNASDIQYISGVAITSHQDLSYISGVIDNKLDFTAFSTVSGDYATTSYVDMNDDLTYDRTTAWVDQNYVADSEISDASGVWNDTSNCVQTNSGAWSNGGGTYDVVTANSANWNSVSSKLDISSFESYTASVASADYELSAGVGISLYDDALNEITRIDVTGSFDNEEVNQVVESNSAAWFDNVGDVEVNNYVYNNSAINDAVNGLVSSNSASWNGKLNKSDFDTYSGTVNDNITALFANDTYFSGAIDYLSGNAGKTYTGISPIVVNNTTNEISADSQDIIFGSGLDFTNGVLSVTVPTYSGDVQEALDEVYTNSGVWSEITGVSSKYQPIGNYALENDLEQVSGDLKGDIDYISGVAITAHQDISNKLDTTAFSTVSGNFLTAVDLTPYYTTAEANTMSSMLSGAIDYVSAHAGDEFPASANEAITVYQNSSGTYLTAHQPISANEWNSVYETVETNSGSWTGGGGTSLTGDAQGAVDEVYSNSADWNSNYSTVYSNSSTWSNGGFTGEVYGISGVSPNVNVYIDQNTLWISAAAGGAGNPEVESYVQTNSASIDEVVSTYETNSGTYLTAHQDISANEWNSVYDTVESNSGSWTGGGSTADPSEYSPYFLALSSTSANVGNGNTVQFGGWTFGQNAKADNGGVVFGTTATAGSFSFGCGTRVNADGASLTIGYNNEAITSCVAVGNNAKANYYSIAVGNNASAIDYSLAVGLHTSAYKAAAAIGYDVSAGKYSQAFGRSVIITNTGMAIGQYNKESADASFVIGNGTSTDARSDSFIIYHDGSVSAMGKISANGVELGTGGASYTAGSGIDITNDTISVTGYSLSGAGSVSISEDNNVIIISGGAPTGDFATTGELNTVSSILSGAVDYVSANAGANYSGIYPIIVDNTSYQISADVEEISALDVSFGTGLDFTSGVLSVSGYATQSDINYISGVIGDVETLLASL